MADAYSVQWLADKPYLVANCEQTDYQPKPYLLSAEQQLQIERVEARHNVEMQRLLELMTEDFENNKA